MAPLTLRLLGIPLAAAGIALTLSANNVAGAATPIGLGTASTFAVLAGSTATNTGPTTINGDVGVSPGTALTGFTTATVTGTQHAADSIADQAQLDLTTAYNTAAGLSPTASVTADLGGQTLAPGVYAGPTLGLTGTLTLDAANDPNATFVFQAGSTLTTASGSVVALIRGANPCNVFWQIGSSATLGTNSVFSGSVLALTSITATTGAKVNGRVLSRNGATTLDTSTVTVPLCAAAVGSPSSTTAPAATPTASVAPSVPASATASPSAAPTSSTGPTASSAPSATATATAAPASTAPVVRATSAPPALGGAKGSPSVTPSPTPSPASSSSVVPETQGEVQNLPQTGAPIAHLAGVGLIAFALGLLLLLLSAVPPRRRPA